MFQSLRRSAMEEAGRKFNLISPHQVMLRMNGEMA